MAQLILMVGIPASGKSTIAKQILENNMMDGIPTVIISNDDVGKVLTGKQFCKSAGGFITATVGLMVRYFLAQDYVVVVDNTCVTQGSRSQWVKVAEDFSASVTVQFMSTDLKTCLDRNATRLDSVPAGVLIDMSKRLEPPESSEGFKYIIKC